MREEIQDSTECHGVAISQVQAMPCPRDDGGVEGRSIGEVLLGCLEQIRQGRVVRLNPVTVVAAESNVAFCKLSVVDLSLYI